MKVLQARKELETEIYHLLKMDKNWLDNTSYNRAACQEDLEKILKEEMVRRDSFDEFR